MEHYYSDISTSQFIEMFGGEPQDKMLNDVCDFISGKSIPKTKEDDFGNVAYIKVADFNLAGNEKYITTSSRYVSQDAAKYSVTINVGSVIFAKNGAASMSNKKRLTKVPCCIDMNTLSVSPQYNYMLPEYLYAIFEAIDIAAFVRQGAIPSIDIQALKNLHIPVPPIKLQQQFVTIAEQADKSGFDGIKSQFIEMFGDPVTNPKGLPMKTIKDVCKISGGSQPPRTEFVFEPKEGYVRFIQIRDYKSDDHITYIKESSTKKFCEADDIMIGRYGPPYIPDIEGYKGGL